MAANAFQYYWIEEGDREYSRLVVTHNELVDDYNKIVDAKAVIDASSRCMSAFRVSSLATLNKFIATENTLEYLESVGDEYSTFDACNDAIKNGD